MNSMYILLEIVGNRWETMVIIPVIVTVHGIAEAFSDRYMYVSYGGNPPRTALGKCENDKFICDEKL